ncbi:putative defense protein isoform X2 [Daphnia pulex]|uniref:putative defense protein isoform X2 n=1 Tax=Daphnia pulex TaxID=6669 RepID=UPI001EDD3599|nr:putative defense protein isoform X2 [Daphnia pulex]
MPSNGKAAFVCASAAVISSVLLLLILAPVQQTQGYSNGAPTVSCGDMIPQHGVDAQFGPSPFLIHLMDGEIVLMDNSVHLELRSSDPQIAFEGYFIMAFDKNDHSAHPRPIGRFKQSANDVKVIDCPGGMQNAVTHKASDDKQFVTVYWTPPEYFVGSVTFRTTYLRNGTVFWVNTLAANPVQVVNVATTTISPSSTTTELITPPTTLSSTDASCSDATSDSSDIITPTTETMFNTTEEEENSTSILTTPTAEATTTTTPTTNKPPNSGLASEFVITFHVLVVGLTCWTVLVYLSNNYLLF